MKKVLVIGSINQDIVTTTDKSLAPGETVFGNSLNYFPGGKGANQAIAANNINKHVTLMGKVGADGFGKEMLKYFKSVKLKNKVVKESSYNTGTAIINVDKKGENNIIVIKGANESFTFKDLKILNNYKKGDILLLQNEINQNVNHKAVEIAKQKGMTVLMNPAPSYKVPAKIIKLCDYIIVNEHELKEVFGIKLNSKTIDKKLQEASNKFKTNIVLTLGENGFIATSKNGIIKEKGHKVKVVDTTGAGDCFCGTLVGAMANGLCFEESLQLANKIASMSVTKLGASASYPKKEDIF